MHIFCKDDLRQQIKMATHLMRSVQNKKIRFKNRRATRIVTIHSRYDHASSFTLNLLKLKIKRSPNKNKKAC